MDISLTSTLQPQKNTVQCTNIKSLDAGDEITARAGA